LLAPDDIGPVSLVAPAELSWAGGPGEGQEQYYEFNVPAGVHDITANVSLTNDAAEPVDVTITPSGAAGTKVSGTLYVDDLLSDIPPYEQIATNELVGLPYAYTIG
jgi:hypothetical protein